MLKSERKQVILEQLKDHRTVSLDRLVHILKTSESTVRRDLDELESEQKASTGFMAVQKTFIFTRRRKQSRKIYQNIQFKQRLQKKLLALFRIMM